MYFFSFFLFGWCIFDAFLMHVQHFYRFFLSFFYKLWRSVQFFLFFFFSFTPFQFHWPQPVWQHYVYCTFYIAYQQTENHKTKWGVFLDAHWKEGMFRVFLEMIPHAERSVKFWLLMLWISLTQEMSHVDMLGVYACRMNSHSLC